MLVLRFVCFILICRLREFTYSMDMELYNFMNFVLPFLIFHIEFDSNFYIHTILVKAYDFVSSYILYFFEATQFY